MKWTSGIAVKQFPIGVTREMLSGALRHPNAMCRTRNDKLLTRA